MAAKRTAVEPAVDVTEVERSFLPLDGKLECTVSSKFNVNYGDYEKHEIFACAKGMFDSEADPDKVAEYMDERVFSLMAPQIKAAQDFAIRESFARKFETG